MNAKFFLLYDEGNEAAKRAAKKIYGIWVSNGLSVGLTSEEFAAVRAGDVMPFGVGVSGPASSAESGYSLAATVGVGTLVGLGVSGE